MLLVFLVLGSFLLQPSAIRSFWWLRSLLLFYVSEDGFWIGGVARRHLCDCVVFVLVDCDVIGDLIVSSLKFKMVTCRDWLWSPIEESD